MEFFKKLTLLLFVVAFASCSSDDDNSATTPTTITASGTVAWSSFSPVNLDITSLVTIGGQPAASYTVSTIKGDIVRFQFNTSAKNVAKVTRELVFLYIDIDSPNVADGQFLDNITYLEDPNNTAVEGKLGFIIGPGAPDNYDGKFNMIFAVKEDGNYLQSDYVVDPKIKIRGTRE